MLKSMTGFGRAEKNADGYNIKVNIRSVNHRYADITVRLPRLYVFAEDKIRRRAMEYISRGKVEVLFSIEKTEGGDRTVDLDESMAENYIRALRKLTQFGLEDDIKASTLAQYSEIFMIHTDEADEEHTAALLEQVFAEAAEDFVSMRTDEGRRMEKDIREHLDCLEMHLGEVEKRYPEIVEEYRLRLEKKIRDVLSDESTDESRIITEAAIFAERSDIGEETVRLGSHIKEFRKSLGSEIPIGKKLDFIVQEMNRETNTMGSKSGDIEIAKHIVEMKSEIEKIREQIQNVE